MPASSPEPSFEVLFRDYHEAVLRFAQRRLSDDESAGDVVSETFLAAWRHWQRRPMIVTEVRPWLYGIAGNVVRNQRRAGIRQARLEARISGVGLASDPSSLIGEDVADEAVRRDVAWRVLERLPDDDREILQLTGWEGLDLPGLAVALSVSTSTAKVRLYRARRRLETAWRRPPRRRPVPIRPDRSLLTKGPDAQQPRRRRRDRR